MRARDRAQLSPREQQVLSHLLEGKSDKEIAAALSLSTSYVKNLLRSIYAKLDVSGSRELLGLAVKGLIS